jgi:hypothetical protein
LIFVWLFDLVLGSVNETFGLRDEFQDVFSVTSVLGGKKPFSFSFVRDRCTLIRKSMKI